MEADDASTLLQSAAQLSKIGSLDWQGSANVQHDTESQQMQKAEVEKPPHAEVQVDMKSGELSDEAAGTQITRIIMRLQSLLDVKGGSHGYITREITWETGQQRSSSISRQESSTVSASAEAEAGGIGWGASASMSAEISRAMQSTFSESSSKFHSNKMTIHCNMNKPCYVYHAEITITTSDGGWIMKKGPIIQSDQPSQELYKEIKPPPQFNDRSMVYIQSKIRNWYLDVCGHGTCSHTYGVQTSWTDNRGEPGSATWKIIRKSHGSGPLKHGDIVYIQNQWRSKMYLDTCGRTGCGYSVGVHASAHRHGNSGSWRLWKVRGTGIIQPDEEIRIMSMWAWHYLDVCGHHACGGYDVALSPRHNRWGKSGTWTLKFAR